MTIPLNCMEKERRRYRSSSELQELQNLQLQYNCISRLRKGLLKLRNLQRLRLDCNQLVRVEPREFSGLSKLTYLDISHNQLTDIAAVNELPCLEELMASHNKLSGAVDLSRCEKLQELDLSNNRISEIYGLPLLTSLTTVNLSENVFSSTESLGSLCSLQELNFGCNQLVSVCSFAEQFPVLEVLSLVSNSIHSWEELKSLARCCHLVEVNLAGNPTCASEEEQTRKVMELSRLMPQLESLDGVIVNQSNREKQETPITYKAALDPDACETTHQIASHIANYESQMEELCQSLSERFSQVRKLVKSLPKQSPPKPSGSTESAGSPLVSSSGARAQSNCSSRSRIQDAREFAAHYVDS
eukprot:gi/632943580/ref/XP_007887025.1/ PREDICTED: protein phosphatase 1 regulatory subunit SDS22-like isoform X2 [Callorhinchus milii]